MSSTNQTLDSPKLEDEKDIPQDEVIQITSDVTNEKLKKEQERRSFEGNTNPQSTDVTATTKIQSSMRNFYVLSSGYLLFTLTDSALRMIVLLELFSRHYNVRFVLRLSFCS